MPIYKGDFFRLKPEAIVTNQFPANINNLIAARDDERKGQAGSSVYSSRRGNIYGNNNMPPNNSFARSPIGMPAPSFNTNNMMGNELGSMPGSMSGTYHDQRNPNTRNVVNPGQIQLNSSNMQKIFTVISTGLYKSCLKFINQPDSGPYHVFFNVIPNTYIQLDLIKDPNSGNLLVNYLSVANGMPKGRMVLLKGSIRVINNTPLIKGINELSNFLTKEYARLMKGI